MSKGLGTKVASILRGVTAALIRMTGSVAVRVRSGEEAVEGAVVRAGTQNSGGGLVEIGGESIVIRADTRARTTADLAALPVKFAGGPQPLRLGELATGGMQLGLLPPLGEADSGRATGLR